MNLNLLLQYILPHHLLSRFIALFANCQIGWLKNLIIIAYCKFYHIDAACMAEMLEANPLKYPTFNEFFIRALKPGARLINQDKRKIMSPVDGKIWQIGRVDDQLLIQAKGKGFTLEQLLASKQEAPEFAYANFSVIYLAPYNYHCIHMPVAGKLLTMRYIPGKLFSVNPNIIANIPDVFAKNERVVLTFATEFGNMVLVLVGAMIVGSIETVWHGPVTPTRNQQVTEWDYSKQEIRFAKGEQVAHFKLGSTVIVLFPENTIIWQEQLQQFDKIQMGQNLGALKQ